ncbi:FixJ family two-component response regulator [Microbacterium marinum]|uniref:FixJ family two-component response regulator n=1 Tax=Microbacterium marinum TaxID=421115 RepID=A0A7W7BSP0_9MICO|nr:hypothetical protein [Microbacterium marinum]MBB4666963.1 FixJ family two-component response regulator [Microbacterium marinum]
MWGTTREIASALQISERTVKRYTADPTVTIRRAGKFRSLGDVVRAEQEKRRRMKAGGRK